MSTASRIAIVVVGLVSVVSLTLGSRWAAQDEAATGSPPPSSICQSSGCVACPQGISECRASNPNESDRDVATRLSMLYRVIDGMGDRSNDVAICFAPGTDPRVVQEMCEQYPQLCGRDEEGRYFLSGRWSGAQGSPRVLTWSLVPDGLNVDGASSELFSRMDSQFNGNRTLWISKFQECFNRWAALTGLYYQRITYGGLDWDDGAAWGTDGGSDRGDIRIGMINIDGTNGVLAYNYYPSNGDMVMDRSENWAQSANNYRWLRNIVMHEHGHGIGLAHICPPNGFSLMEPYINTGFDGPQHDDIRAGQEHYGDAYESDNNSATATNLGTLVHDQVVTVGTVPSPTVNYGSLLGIDADGEQDWFKFTVGFDAAATVTVTPVGLTYDSSPQECSGDINCCSGNNVNSLAVADLNFQIIGQDGSTVIATGDSQPAGSVESLSEVGLPGGAGTFYLKVYEGNAPSDTQLYLLQLHIYDWAGDHTPPSPNPMTWASQPTPIVDSPSQIAMTAALASDPSGVTYNFDCAAGSCHTSGWSASRDYIDSGLVANSPYSYVARARDQSQYLNQTQPSSQVQTVTSIEKPTTLSFSDVQETSMQVDVPGAFTNLAYYSSGIFLEVKLDGEPVGGGDANTWKKSQVFDVTELSPGMSYTFRAKARNLVAFETTYTAPFVQQTEGGAICALNGDVNGDGSVDGDDVPGFVRARLGQDPFGGENQTCADYGTGTLAGDLQLFIADLLE